MTGDEVTGGVTLRRTTDDDLGAVLAMEAAPDTRRWLGRTGRGWHTDIRADPGAEHLTAVRHTAPDTTPVGFVVLVGPRTGDPGTELRRLVVAESRRGAGLGRAVLRAAVARVADAGGRRVWLDVRPDNERALALYRGEGFTRERALPADPRDPHAPTALVVLSRDL